MKSSNASFPEALSRAATTCRCIDEKNEASVWETRPFNDQLVPSLLLVALFGSIEIGQVQAMMDNIVCRPSWDQFAARQIHSPSLNVLPVRRDDRPLVVLAHARFISIPQEDFSPPPSLPLCLPSFRSLPSIPAVSPSQASALKRHKPLLAFFAVPRGNFSISVRKSTSPSPRALCPGTIHSLGLLLPFSGMCHLLEPVGNEDGQAR